MKLLRGIRVVDFSRLIPGAGLTQQLADHGADVIKLERPPVGDYLRTIPPLFKDRGYFHLMMNRNKRSLGVDDRTDEGKEIIEKLVRQADVFVESNRPGATDRAGFGYHQLRQVNPKLVYCSISGFGQDGPYAEIASHGLNIDAFAGVLAVDHAGDRPRVSDDYLSIGTILGPIYAAQAVGFALVAVGRTGEGTYLDASCWDGAIQHDFRNITHTLNEGTPWPSYSSLGPRYDIYITADRQEVMICPIEAKFWRNFCDAIGRLDLIDEAESGVVEFGDPSLREIIQLEVGERTLKEWLRLTTELDLPISPVYRPGQTVEDPHLAARGRVATVKHPIDGDFKMLGPPVQTGGYVAQAAPELGQHTEEILRELEFEHEQIDRLRESGTVVG